ncbi:MAG: lipocalin family protein [Candidatus Firestonebacteria bacterium]|nr:lipocalin family protein [Candidatus Firestonebacteria bacterium]
MRKKFSYAILGLFALAGCSHMPQPPEVQTVEHVDLKRYLGTWYEIATLPAWFEKDAVAVTADYSLNPDGTVKVVNACRRKNLDGPKDVANGTARVVDTVSNAKLKVSFFLWFAGDYWIMELGKDYDYAVIGGPDRQYFWILSRTATMNETLYRAILQRAAGQGYDLSRLRKTPQRPSI